MDEIYEEINNILAKLNPIGVCEDIALDEYGGYIPVIVHFLQNRQELMEYLEKILIDDMGLNYDSYNEKHFDNLQKVCDNLMKIYRNRKKQ